MSKLKIEIEQHDNGEWSYSVQAQTIGLLIFGKNAATEALGVLFLGEVGLPLKEKSKENVAKDAFKSEFKDSEEAGAPEDKSQNKAPDWWYGSYDSWVDAGCPNSVLKPLLPFGWEEPPPEWPGDYKMWVAAGRPRPARMFSAKTPNR